MTYIQYRLIVRKLRNFKFERTKINMISYWYFILTIRKYSNYIHHSKVNPFEFNCMHLVWLEHYETAQMNFMSNHYVILLTLHCFEIHTITLPYKLYQVLLLIKIQRTLISTIKPFNNAYHFTTFKKHNVQKFMHKTSTSQ